MKSSDTIITFQIHQQNCTYDTSVSYILTLEPEVPKVQKYGELGGETY